LLIICDSVTEKAKYGKMRQVNAVNGSQMVVKIGVAYYRRKQEHKVTSQKLSSLLYTITTDFSTIKKRHSAAALKSLIPKDDLMLLFLLLQSIT
jgi:hypothetical protein